MSGGGGGGGIVVVVVYLFNVHLYDSKIEIDLGSMWRGRGGGGLCV